MAKWLRELDQLLRGERTRPEALAEGTGDLALAPLVAASIVLGALYGLAMALYVVLNREPPTFAQFPSSAVKVPALFFLTLLVTFPSLYVFSALLGASARPASALRIVVAAVTVSMAVLASLAPITAFFTFTTSSYPFMKLLNVFLLGVAGVVGLVFLRRALRNVEEAEGMKDADAAAPRAARLLPLNVGLFNLWVLLYGLVGLQMAWLLRPFIGDPERPFELFRERGGSVFLDILGSLAEVVGAR